MYRWDNGDKSFVVSYELLHKDNRSYKAYPNGIDEGTPFAIFLGKQANEFLNDFNFDYIWFSNGFGFGAENWATTGLLFDGETFVEDKVSILNQKEKTLNFWKLFRKECPDYEVQTRGANLSVGIDFATDEVATVAIYNGKLNIVPPPNSPWAALDKNFGIELSGYMSRIAELPQNSNYMFRFYLHDPWWMNSPWFDRYEGEPHDIYIYMPLAIARIDDDLKIETPEYMNFLSIDNSLGDMPEEAVLSISPHIDKALKTLPDKLAPILWVYPFHEYQNEDVIGNYNLKKPFFEDWFITSAINGGMPINNVISTTNFAKYANDKYDYFKGTIILSPVPYKGTKHETALISYVENGGKVLMYGSLSDASKDILSLLNVRKDEGLDGELQLQSTYKLGDENLDDIDKIFHNPNLSGGMIDTVIDNEKLIGSKVVASVRKDNEVRVSGVKREIKGTLVWIRGSNANEVRSNSNLLVPYAEDRYFPRSFHRECRVFVDQKDNGVISMSEYGPVSVIMKRRILLEGLKDATIYVFGEEGKEEKLELLLNSVKPNSVGEEFHYELVETEYGKAYKAEHITGHVMCSMEFDEMKYLEERIKENE